MNLAAAFKAGREVDCNRPAYMYGNIDREVPAIQYPVISLLLALPLSLSLFLVRVLCGGKEKKREKRHTEDGGRGKGNRATSATTIQRRQERDNRGGCAGPVPTRFFPSSVLLFPTSSNSAGSYAAGEDQAAADREERGNERRRRRRKEHLSLLWKSIEKSSESASPGQRLCHLIGYVEQFILFFPIPRGRGALREREGARA